jgi:hypothetical protein
MNQIKFVWCHILVPNTKYILFTISHFRDETLGWRDVNSPANIHFAQKPHELLTTRQVLKYE